MIALILMLAVIGFLLYLVLTYVPMPQAFKTTILVVVIIVVILYLIRIFGVGDIPVPRLRQ